VVTIIKQKDPKNKSYAPKRPKSSRRPGTQYSEQQLIIIYLQKYASLGRPPSISEINSDPDLPSYWTFLRRLGDKDLICKKLSLANIPAEIHRQLCKDCLYQPASCQQDPFVCASQANLYYRSTDSRKLTAN